jgi:hypothetical protein
METTQQFLTQIAMNVALAGVALLAAYATNAMHKLTEKVKAETMRIKSDEQRKLLNDALDDVDILTKKTVAQIEQTTAKTLREAVKEGIRDKRELEALSIQAFNEIAEALKPESKAMIEENFGDFSKYLTKVIEEKVLELKSESQ